jgi:hypothetical protein
VRTGKSMLVKTGSHAQVMGDDVTQPGLSFSPRL